MKVQSLSTVIAFSLAIILHADTANAFPVTWEFEGVVTSFTDSENVLGGSVVEGSVFTGTFTFESTTLDSFPDDDRSGIYYDAITNISGMVGGNHFMGPAAGSNNRISITNNFIDSLRFRSDIYFLNEIMLFRLSLGNGPDTILSTDDLSVNPPDLSLFESASFSIGNGSETNPLFIHGNVHMLVPEPSTLILMSILAVTPFFRKKNRKGQSKTKGEVLR